MATMTPDRWEEELRLLRGRYAEVVVGGNRDWVLIKDLGLSEGWNRESTDVLTLIPAGYPATAPDNFYVPEGLRLDGGNIPGNYGDGHDAVNGKWGRFSFHVQRWRPDEMVLDGDNLLTFMLAVEKRLREVS